MPAFDPQLVIEVLNKLQRFISIRAHNRMNQLTKKSKEYLCWTLKEVEPSVLIDPVIRPIGGIVHPMLPDITRRILEPTIERGHRFEIVDPLEELNLLQPPTPCNLIKLQSINDVLPSCP
jgi:hypothetical protein